MRSVIYSKFSNERADNFKIRTDILIDDKGKKIVRKVPLTQEAKVHINSIYNSYNLLSEMYRDSELEFNKCYRAKFGIELEYITGNTLEEELDGLLVKKKYQEFIDSIRRFINILEEKIGEKHFKSTKQFEEVFGKVQLPNSLSAADINNIDFIFSNIIIRENFEVIDYEWTFDFPIPFNFIIYRAIHYYIIGNHGSNKRKEILDLGLYKLFNITEIELKQYEIMEQNFQRYVLGKLVPLSHLNESLLKKIEINRYIEWEKSKSSINTIQIYFDYGYGFNEKDSYNIKIPISNEGKANFEIPLKLKVEKMRIDPGNTPCIVSIKNITGDKGKFYNLNFITNGNNITENIILYPTSDPQIILNDIEISTTKIEVDIEIQSISKEISIQLYEYVKSKELMIDKLNHELSKSINEKNILEGKIEDGEIILEKKRLYEEEIQSLQLIISEHQNAQDKIIEENNQKISEKNLLIDNLYSQMELLNTQLIQITGSKSWRFIKKINKILGR